MYEPYTVAIAQPQILWNRYTNLNAQGHPKYNMAESFFAASQMIGWKDVVIGDPKTSITTDSVLATRTLTQEAIHVFPNPVAKELRINYGTRISKIEIYTILGMEVYSCNQEITNRETILDVSALKAGIYFLHLISDTDRRVVKFVKE